LAIAAIRSAASEPTSGWTTASQHGSPAPRFCFGANARSTVIDVAYTVAVITDVHANLPALLAARARGNYDDGSPRKGKPKDGAGVRIAREVAAVGPPDEFAEELVLAA
jgi:hypothetical protein